MQVQLLLSTEELLKYLTIDLNEKEHLQEMNRQIQLYSPQNLELHDHLLACVGLLMVNALQVCEHTFICKLLYLHLPDKRFHGCKQQFH